MSDAGLATTLPRSEEHLFLVVNGWARHTPWLHGVMSAYAGYGVVLFGLLLVAGWWVARRQGEPRRMALALWAGVGTLVAVGINQPIVKAVDEARPYSVLPHILVLAPRTADPSFPSDHAVMAGACAAGLLLVSRRLGAVTSVAALVLAFARVYTAAHWPYDVLAGLLVGVAVTLVGGLVVVPALARLVARLARTPLRPLLVTGQLVPSSGNYPRGRSRW